MANKKIPEDVKKAKEKIEAEKKKDPKAFNKKYDPKKKLRVE